AALSAIRAAAEADTARKADDRGRAARHEHLAASYCAMRDHYQLQEQALAQAMADRQEWEQVTAGSRRLAIAADAELRRRHPDRRSPPLQGSSSTPLSTTSNPTAKPRTEQGAIEAGDARGYLKIHHLLPNRPSLHATNK